MVNRKDLRVELEFHKPIKNQNKAHLSVWVWDKAKAGKKNHLITHKDFWVTTDNLEEWSGTKKQDKDKIIEIKD